MKRTIWMPIVLGLLSGTLDYVTWAAGYSIPIGNTTVIGPQESISVFSAALGGPLSMVITEIISDIGVYNFVADSFLAGLHPNPLYLVLANFFAHVCALLAVVFCYRYLYNRAKNMFVFLAGWLITIAVVYYGALDALQVVLLNLVAPGAGLTFGPYYLATLPEMASVFVLTALFFLALPRRYRRPLWIEPKPGTLSVEKKI